MLRKIFETKEKKEKKKFCTSIAKFLIIKIQIYFAIERQKNCMQMKINDINSNYVKKLNIIRKI